MQNSFPAFEKIVGNPSCGIVLLADHACNFLPPEYGTLGLPEDQFSRHIAYDIGVEEVTRKLAARLDAPAVLSRFSRLLIDPNRGEDDPTLVMRLSDGTVVPGNHPLSSQELQKRVQTWYTPYHQAIGETIEACMATGTNPIIFSIHSFTHNWRGQTRKWHGAMLWDADPRIAEFMIDGLRQDPALIIGNNEPYDGALKNDTMYRHATKRGLAQGLLEIRQDLISDDAGIAEWVDRLAPLLKRANKRPEMHRIMDFGSRSDGTAKTGQ